MSEGRRCVVVTVPKKGLSTGKSQITVEAHGFTGTSCKTATAAIQAALGIQLAEEVKPEMYQANEGVEYNQQG